MRLSSIENGISVLRITGCAPTAVRIRSSRYSVMSSAPVGTSCWLMSWIACASRLRQRHAARADADERQLVDAAIAFENFVRDAREAAADSVGVENDGHREPLRVLAGTR